MLDALEHVPGAQLTLAGEFESSALRDEIRARLRDKRLPVRLIDRFVPEDEAAKLFAEASLVVLPYTNFHAQSGVLYLALSHGLPVVATDVGAVGEFVRNEQVGKVCPPHDATALAQAIVRTLEPKAYEAFRQNCVRLSSSLSWKEAAERTLRCYEAVVRAEETRSAGAAERTGDRFDASHVTARALRWAGLSPSLLATGQRVARTPVDLAASAGSRSPSCLLQLSSTAKKNQSDGWPV